MFLQENGHRPGVRSVMVLMTDGKTNPASEDFSKAVKSLKAKGVRLLVVAVGPKSKEAKYQEVLKSIAGDGVYNASDYDNLNALFDDLEKTICPDDHDEQICAVDLALIADKTESIGKNPFKLLKGFLLEITDSMIISPFATHEAVITYAKNPKVLNKFDESKYHSNEAMHMLIENIPITLGSQTRTDKALKAAIELFEDSRPGFPNVLALFTDGKTHPTSEPYDQIIPLLEAKNVHIIAVGIGNNIYEEELKKIAGNNIYLVDDFDDLSNLYEILRDEICRSALDGLPAEK